MWNVFAVKLVQRPIREKEKIAIINVVFKEEKASR